MSNPATCTEDDLVKYLRRFRGTQRAARLREQHPAAAALADQADAADVQAAATTPAAPAPGRAAADAAYVEENAGRTLRERLAVAEAREVASRAPLPVEIRRPRWTREEATVELIGTVLSASIRTAIVRAAARRVFGITLTRRDAFLLSVAVASCTNGSAYRLWTRETPRVSR